MKQTPNPKVLALPLFQRAELALQEAFEEMVEEHVRNKWPIYICRDGKVVDILPDKLQQRSATARTA